MTTPRGQHQKMTRIDSFWQSLQTIEWQRPAVITYNDRYLWSPQTTEWQRPMITTNNVCGKHRKERSIIIFDLSFSSPNEFIYHRKAKTTCGFLRHNWKRRKSVWLWGEGYIKRKVKYVTDLFLLDTFRVMDPPHHFLSACSHLVPHPIQTVDGVCVLGG